MAQFTKAAIVSSFIELLNERPFDKISVVDIAEKCGINRNTFYYYYADVYALVDEIFQTETRKMVELNLSCGSWQEVFMGPEERCAVLFVDIDDFKALNDTHGHIEGDRWLMAIGGALQALCRKDDIVFRFGGDEFVVLLKDLPGGDTAEQKARRFSDSIAELSGPRLSKVTCSVGICYAGRGGGSIAELAAKADASLYDAKKRDKDSYAIYTD